MLDMESVTERQSNFRKIRKFRQNVTKYDKNSPGTQKSAIISITDCSCQKTKPEGEFFYYMTDFFDIS